MTKLQYAFEAKGKILRMPEKFLAVPYQSAGSGFYFVVIGYAHDCTEEMRHAYPIGGYNFWAGAPSLLNAEIVEVPNV